MAEVFRPIVQQDRARPSDALALAGGPLWFERVEVLRSGVTPETIHARDLPAQAQERLTTPRADLCGISMQHASIMAVLNVTPDSFSDGGEHDDPVASARRMLAEGADIIDLGGESTRPGAQTIADDVEISRTVPVIGALRENGIGPISIDTRKPAVARAAIAAGAGLFNDVSALTYAPDSLAVAAQTGVAVCLMHAGGPPETMQDNPRYDDVLPEVYAYLESRVDACVKAGIARAKILVDPGIGFGKTLHHNLALLRGLSAFHGLGCPVLLGVSRKGFIGKIASVPDPKRRFAGSMTVALEGLRQGVQMLRVHDIAQTRQAIDLWQAMIEEPQ